jgi:hypothetical protein
MVFVVSWAANLTQDTYPKSNRFCKNKKRVLTNWHENPYPDYGIGSLFNAEGRAV